MVLIYYFRFLTRLVKTSNRRTKDYCKWALAGRKAYPFLYILKYIGNKNYVLLSRVFTSWPKSGLFFTR